MYQSHRFPGRERIINAATNPVTCTSYFFAIRSAEFPEGLLYKETCVRFTCKIEVREFNALYKFAKQSENIPINYTIICRTVMR